MVALVIALPYERLSLSLQYLHRAKLNIMKRFFAKFSELQIIAFTTGFALMAFELVAARILAPTVGSSTYVWTSVIGVVIAALSLGYFAGGKLADSRQRQSDIAYLCLLAAIAVLLVLVTYQPTLEMISSFDTDRRWQALLASLLLFAPASFVLGAISPYLAKFAVRSLSTTARSIASLSALNSIGGIVGTFVSGFILFGYIGSRETLVVVIVLLVGTSWLAIPRHNISWRLAVSVGVMMTALIAAQPPVNSTDIDTASAHYQILEGYIDNEPRKVRVLTTGPSGAQSGVLTDGSGELVFWYTQQMAEIVSRVSERDKVLVLGGGTFTLPQYLARQYPSTKVDVVEIDAGLEKIAQQHFYFDPPANLRIIVDDARAYLNSTDEQYDIILIDVYSDTSVPFALLTKEYGDQVRDRLTPEGVVAINVIAATEGPCQPLLEAIAAPYGRHWSRSWLAEQRPSQPTDPGNMMLVYSQSDLDLGANYRALPQLDVPNYTDNFIPAERLQQSCQ